MLLGDSAAVTSPLIPWNGCGAYMAATLGVATAAYVPFAFFNLINPLVSIGFAFLGLRMLRKVEAKPHSDVTAPEGRPALKQWAGPCSRHFADHSRRRLRRKLHRGGMPSDHFRLSDPGVSFFTHAISSS